MLRNVNWTDVGKSLLFVAGLACVAVGVGLYDPRLGLVVGGGELVILSIVWSLPHE